MIPIIAINSGILSVFLLFSAIRTYSTHKRTKDKYIEYFFWFFLFLGITTVLGAMQGVIVSDLKWLDFMFDVYTFPGAIGLAFLVKLTLDLLDRKTLEKISFFTIIILSFILALIPALDWQPAKVATQGPFIFWEDNRGPTINALTGVVLSLPVLWIVAFFIYKGIKSESRYVRIKAFLISAGMLFFMLSGAVDLIVGADPNIFYVSSVSSVLSVLAIFIFQFALYYRFKKPFEALPLVK